MSSSTSTSPMMNVRSAQLTECLMIAAKFAMVDLTDAKMLSCDLTRAFFYFCDLTRLDLTGSDVTDATFLNCTDGGKAISAPWLAAHGALNVGKARVEISISSASPSS